MAVFILHKESSGYAARTDLAVLRNGKVSHIFTLGVENGNCVGALFHPFEKGMTEEQILKRVEEYNTPPPGADCTCGMWGYHTHSAGCSDKSELLWLTAEEAVATAAFARRSEIAHAVLGLVRRLDRQGEIPYIPPEE